jgi:hypothetical protein
VAVGADLQRAVDTHPAGTTFCLAAGVHRLAHAVPRQGQRFVGEGRDTVLSGARVLPAAEARRDGSGHWFWDRQWQQSEPHGSLIAPGYAETPNPGDAYSEELFVTRTGDPRGAPQRYRRVLSLSQLGQGRWYFDYRTDRIYMSDDPARLGLVETSVTPSAISAISGSGQPRVRDVAVENLVVEKYASPAQLPALGGDGALDWDIRYVTVRYNHGAGAELGPGTLMENSKIHHMGQEGLLGENDEASSRPTVLRSTEVAYNKTLSFDPDWEAGGAKFTRAYGRGMIVENSWFHHNLGGGLWFDIDNLKVVVRSNRIEANDRWGVLYEVSRGAQIYWNEVFGTTSGPERFRYNGAGILISNSADVDVRANLLYDNDNGILVSEDGTATRWAQGTFRQGLPHVRDVDVHDNDVSMSRGVTGMRVENADAIRFWRTAGVRFAGNVYRLDDRQSRFSGLGNYLYRFVDWSRLGNDRDGRVDGLSTRGALPDRAAAFKMGAYGASGDNG